MDNFKYLGSKIQSITGSCRVQTWREYCKRDGVGGGECLEWFVTSQGDITGGRDSSACSVLWDRAVTLRYTLVYRIVGGIFPCPSTTQTVYQGIEWFSHLAGLQWLTVLSMLIRGITIACGWQPYFPLSCYAALFWLRVKFDIFLSWECYDSRHPNYVSALKHNCNVMRGEAEMGLDIHVRRRDWAIGVRVHM